MPVEAHRSDGPDLAAAPPVDGPAADPRLRGRRRRAGVVVEVLAVIACGVFTLPRGQDDSFDLLNYHWLYSWLLWHGGIGQVDPEPFTNRYINPLAQLPWYALEHVLPPLGATLAIALLGGLNLVLVRRITLRLLPAHLTGWWPLLLSSTAMLLAGLGTVFRTELGMSLADVLVSLPMLGALLLVLRATSAPRPTALACGLAGLLSGVAVGIKLTMATYTVALAAAVVYLAVRRRSAAVVAAHLAGGVIGVAVSAGWWFWSVWQATGNPVFPYWNGIFRSPYWGTANLRDERFGPHGLLDALQYPLYMAQGTGRLLDVPIRDPRWLVLCVLGTLALAAVAARALARRSGGHTLQARQAGTPLPGPGSRDAAVVFLLFFLVSGLLWLVQFGIARYAVTSELLVGPLLVLCLLWLLRRPVPVLVAGLVLAAVMAPLTRLGPYLHRPFAPTRFEVQAAPLRAVPRGSVVISDAGDAASGFLLTYLPDGVRRHVVHPWFYGSPVLRRLQAQQLAVAPHVYVIEGSGGRRSATVRRVRDEIGLQLHVARCVPVHSIVPARWLCPATWVGPAGSGRRP